MARFRNVINGIGLALVVAGLGLFGPNAELAAGNPHYQVWSSPMADCAYATVAAGLLCLARSLSGGWGRRGRQQRVNRTGVNILELERLKEIAAIASRSTDVEAQRALAHYIGRQMRLSVRIVDVGAWTGTHSSVTAKTRVRRMTVVMRFTNKLMFDEYLSIAKAGERMTVRGRIERIKRETIWLHECIIESALSNLRVRPAR